MKSNERWKWQYLHHHRDTAMSDALIETGPFTQSMQVQLSDFKKSYPGVVM